MNDRVAPSALDTISGHNPRADAARFLTRDGDRLAVVNGERQFPYAAPGTRGGQ